MDDAKLAMLAARCRIALGAAAVLVPGLAARVMGGRRGSKGIGPLFARMLGARDVALGLGTVIALDRGAPVRGWLEGSALADWVPGPRSSESSYRGALTRRHRRTQASRRLLRRVTSPSRSLASNPLTSPGEGEAVTDASPI
jgi:hypothetical protein